MSVLIPKAIAGDLQLSEGTSLEISSNSEGIVLRRQGRRARRSMATIAAEIKRSGYRRRGREFSADGPVGREIW